jgi:hypothetical protein
LLIRWDKEKLYLLESRLKVNSLTLFFQNRLGSLEIIILDFLEVRVYLDIKDRTFALPLVTNGLYMNLIHFSDKIFDNICVVLGVRSVTVKDLLVKV